MRPGICMECNFEIDRSFEKHTSIDCINKLKAENYALNKELSILKEAGNQMYRAIVFTSGVDLNYAADEWIKTRDGGNNGK
jgi:hypothetical protein